MRRRLFCAFHPPYYILAGTTTLCAVVPAIKEKKVVYMLLKRCKCGKLIPQQVYMCEACEREYKAYSRHALYNKTRRNDKAAAFYISKEWKALRSLIIRAYNNIDIYAFYTMHEIFTCQQVHHIVEVEEDWERRLDPMNLIPLHGSTHSVISALYKKDEKTKKETQNKLKVIIEMHFEGAGGYKKVLERLGVVAPPVKFGENSPREFP